ncbi:agmatine deiminase family protein [Wukongibacter baidiensis]|uniref:agmatine deiminase family protein n=1 Tax=Wukongibacter baidiensis TaxID=1723361 RepID=UPI003D7F6069
MLNKNFKLLSCLVILTMLLSIGCANATIDHKEDTKAVDDGKRYYFPHENSEHEGTWLQWPHDYTYEGTSEVYDPIWIEMTRGLVKGENVHLIVYDEKEKERVKALLEKEDIDMTKVDFYVFPTDDVWVRDNGPIFAYDEEDNLVIQNWQFNGWGNKAPYEKDNSIPTKISESIGIPKVDIDMVMEGGALELDGNGTVISTLSCVNNDNRTANFSIEEIEAYLTKYYGVTNFIWLDGVAGMDITDNHIDGMIKIYDDKTIIAAPEFNPESPDFEEYEDTEKLLSAKNINGRPYDFVFLPSTKNNVVKVDGEWMKGAYMNFYVANEVVLVPNYDDPNDKVANKILQDIYTDREVIGIDVRDLFADGGMIHCVTQQQPIANPK